MILELNFRCELVAAYSWRRVAHGCEERVTHSRKAVATRLGLKLAPRRRRRK